MGTLKAFSFITLFSVCAHAEGHKLHPGIRSFQGEKFEIELKARCPESSVTCNDVSYDAISKKTGEKLHLTGRLLSNPTKDHQWYEFENGKYLYMLTADYSPSAKSTEWWVLNVTCNGEFIASDEGSMY
jgi:hypothetical protein